MIRLTPAQRYHLDVFGYVLLEHVLTPDEVSRMKDAIHRLKEELQPYRDQPETRIRGAHVRWWRDHHIHLGHLVEYDPALLEYAVHPKIVTLMEHMVGGAVRLEETEAAMTWRNDALTDEERTRYGFHSGIRHGYGTYIEHHWFHCLFVKALAFLTDVGPDDGGTVVIVGSHKMTLPQEEIIAAAYDDPRLIHRMIAPAGSVLLFPESLIHATGHVTSDRERTILVAGYTPPWMREWPGYTVSEAFVQAAPEAVRPLLSGSESWDWRRNV